MSMNNVTCAHCLLELNKNAAIIETSDNGDEIFFCCHGCQGVYHALLDGGFSIFYDKRTDWEPGPPETVHTTEELFKSSIIKKENELEVTLLLTGIRCASCIWLVENYLKKKNGISYVRVNYATHKAKIRWDDTTTLNEIITLLSSIGYSPLPANESSASSLVAKERKDYFYRFSIGMFFSMQVMMFTVALYAGYFQGMTEQLRNLFQWFAFIMATPVMFYSGYPFIINSIRAFRNKVLNMDTLVFLGSFSAYSYSIVAVFTGRETYFDTSSMIITLILLGRFIETGAKVKAGNTIAKLLSLQPAQVRHITNFITENYINNRYEIQTISIESLQKNDYFEILPGSSIPADGIVVYGTSDVDESMLTGESVSVNKSIDANVFAGTINLNGKLAIKVIATGSNTKLSKIAEAVEEAQNRKAPIQNIADKVVGYFVPTIISIAAATFIYWFQTDHQLTNAIMTSISVLVIACPCALGLATPLAILIATGKTASLGAVVKSGDCLEILSKTDTVCFDKTGTITKGQLCIETITSIGMDSKKLLQIASSLEASSNHLIAKALINASEGHLLKTDQIKEHPGKGIKGNVDTQQVCIGNMSFMKDNNITISTKDINVFESLIKKGATVIAVGIDRKLSGFISLVDTLRDNAKNILSDLIIQNLDTVVLTGDHLSAANHLADKLDIDKLTFFSEKTPFEKANLLKRFKEEGRHTIMVGDGINDAPALTEADIGIAMGKGTDIAIESSDIVLLRENLSIIPELLKISKKTLQIIKLNLFWAFSYNIIAIPLAASGKIHPITSAIFMSISSLFVVFNSLRIGRK